MITIDWPTGVITIPQNYLSVIGANLYELDANQFRLDLLDLEDSEDGMIWPHIYNHNTEVVLAGVTYARSIEIINGYTITFEDGQYAVNIVGANTNFADITNVNQVSIRTANSAGLITVAGGGGSGPSASAIATAVWDRLLSAHTNPLTMGGMVNVLNTRTTNTYNLLNGVDFKLDLNIAKTDIVLEDIDSVMSSLQMAIEIINGILKYNKNRTKINNSTKTLTVYDDDGVTPLQIFDLKDFNGVASITEIAERVPQ